MGPGVPHLENEGTGQGDRQVFFYNKYMIFYDYGMSLQKSIDQH